MSIPNTDLLPPLFDHILTHYGEGTLGAYTRADIIKALENGIINAAANHEREAAKLPEYQAGAGNTINLRTFDRLSGDHLSRAALSEELQNTLSLGKVAIEIAVLLVEAQIDLRLKVARSFKLAGIEFMRDDVTDDRPIAGWCQDVLRATLQGSQGDVPNVWNRMGKHRPEGLRILVETLQLSATLRDALPYTIKVDKRLVDPLLAKSGADRRIRLLHISDLHLVEDLTDPQTGGSPTLGQFKHSFDTARLLGRTVGSLQPPFDMLAATGDLTTDGSQGAFETVLQYIQSGPISGENKMRIATFGLNAGPERRLLLPGNHDRFKGKILPGSRLSYLFEEVLNTRKQYPYVCGFRPPGRNEEDLTLLFFVFDSTLPHQNEKGISRLNAIAQGTIGAAELQQLTSLSSKVANGWANGLTGAPINFEPANTVRIALLHHHPVVSQEAEEQQLRGNQKRGWRWFTNPFVSYRESTQSAKVAAAKLLGAEEFLRGCLGAGIQLILFGHDHHPYRRAVVWENEQEVTGPFGSTKSLRAFCCPTTLELSREGNGFYLFDFMDKDTVSLDLYISQPSIKNVQMPFSRIAEQSSQFKLSELSEQETESAHKLSVHPPSELKSAPAAINNR